MKKMNERDITTMEKEVSPEMLDEDFDTIQDIFRQSRQIILDRAGDTEMESTEKEDGSPATATDEEIEAAVLAELSGRFPDLPVFSEEAGYEDEDLEGVSVYFLVDPLDGTSAFKAGDVEKVTCMAASVENGEVTRSVIYHPQTDTTYVFKQGEGTYKYTNYTEDGQHDEVRIDLSQTEMPKTVICKEVLIPELDPLFASVGVTCEPAPSGGGFGFVQVLEEKYAARINSMPGGHTHDYAPGGALVRGANGVLVSVEDYEYDVTMKNYVACHPDFAPLVREHRVEIRAAEQRGLAEKAKKK